MKNISIFAVALKKGILISLGVFKKFEKKYFSGG
jgi:hypothetical protein